MLRVRHSLASIAAVSLVSASLGALGAGCGGGDSGGVLPPSEAGGDTQSDVTIPPPPGSDAQPDGMLPPSPDTGADVGSVDSGADVVPGDGGDGGGTLADGSDGAADAPVDACGGVTITSVTPTQAWNGLTVDLTITGTGFIPCTGDAGACADQFQLGGSGWALTNVSVPSSTTATATVPAGGPVGTYSLIDTQNGCTYSLANAYQILGATALISKIIPPYGWTGDDTPVTVIGSGFVSTPHATIHVPGMSPADQNLKSTAFVSTTSLTSIVPKGLTPGGPYDVTVINPNQTGGTLPAAFRVVSLPVPTISNVTPASLTTSQLGVTDNVTLTGCNFRAPLTVSTVDASGTVVAQTAGTLTCNGAATCPGGTNVCTLPATIGAGLAAGAYVVRLTDNDQQTSGDYSALVVTNPAAKLNTGYVTSSPLNVGRRSLGVASGRINDASRFLYAIAGEDAAGNALQSVEVAPLDLFGTTGSWFVERNTLNSKRSGAAVARLGEYVYVLGGTPSTSGTGGTTPTGTPMASIERAKILDLTDLPAVSDPASAAGSLAAGTWYYRVAVVRDGTDPDNPNGEGLPSDEGVITLSVTGGVTLTWTAPANAAHIAKYRIYRSAVVNGASQSEVFLADTASAATLSYTDDGTVAVGTMTPLQRGSTGVFITQSGALVHARLDANAVIAPDPTGQLYVYVTGGFGACVAATGPMSCYEYATISADGSTLGTFTPGATTFATARARHGAAVMDAANGIVPWSSNAAFVFLSGGVDDAGSSTSAEYAVVTAGGQLGAWTATNSGFAPQRDGGQLEIVNGYLYAFFGGNAATHTYTPSTSFSYATSQTTTTVTLFQSWSDAVAATPTGLGRMGVTLESAYFYVIGGTSNDTDALTSVYQIIY